MEKYTVVAPPVSGTPAGRSSRSPAHVDASAAPPPPAERVFGEWPSLLSSLAGKSSTTTRANLLNAAQLAACERQRDVISSGLPSLDALLPAGGLRRGSLIEWLIAASHECPPTAQTPRASTTDTAAGGRIGTGAVTLACAVACRLAGTESPASRRHPEAPAPRTIVVIDRTGWFYPPAMLPWLDRAHGAHHHRVHLVVARPSRDDDELWTIDQALRCPGVAAVIAWPRVLVPTTDARCRRGPRPPGAQQPTGAGRQWQTAMRRWQLAARASGAIGLIVQPEDSQRTPSWAEARLAVAARAGGGHLQRRLQVRLAGGAWSAALTDGTTELMLDLISGREADPGAWAVVPTDQTPTQSVHWMAGQRTVADDIPLHERGEVSRASA